MAKKKTAEELAASMGIGVPTAQKQEEPKPSKPKEATQAKTGETVKQQPRPQKAKTTAKAKNPGTEENTVAPKKKIGRPKTSYEVETIKKSYMVEPAHATAIMLYQKMFPDCGDASAVVRAALDSYLNTFGVLEYAREMESKFKGKND